MEARLTSAQMVSCFAYDKPKRKNMLQMNGTIPFMFDYWADPVVHLLLLKSSMVKERDKGCTLNCLRERERIKV